MDAGIMDEIVIGPKGSNTGHAGSHIWDEESILRMTDIKLYFYFIIAVLLIYTPLV